jgi:rod shape-determining protein MreD
MGITALLSYVIQTTVFDSVQIYGIKPNLILITTISYALIRGREEGAVYGFSAGLLLDIMGGKTIGIFSLMGLYTGLIIGSLNKRLYNENYIIVFILNAGGSFAYNFIYYLYVYLFISKGNFLWGIIAYIIPETIYNTVLSLIVYFFLLNINKKLDYYKKRLNVKKQMY